MPNAINEISFATSVKSLTLQTYVDALERYRNGIDQALNLKSDLPIFIDTNVFLRYYSIAEIDREPLFEFFSQYKKRIFITAQVQKEIVKNREDVIERFFEDTLEKLKNSFRSDIVNKVGSYREEFKKVINDFSFLGSFLNNLSGELENTYETISEQVANKKSNLNNVKYEDNLLRVMSEMNLIDNLADEDIKTLKLEYEALRKGIESQNVNTEIKKPQKAFPGLGDIKEKPDNPYGDYIIFHELIKYIKETGTDAIFLTYDSSKGDWFRKNKQPHDHYIQATYISTGNIIFFFEAERFFSNKLNKKFDLVFPKNENEQLSKDEYVKDFILKYIEFERLVRGVAERASIDKSNKAPISRIMHELFKIGHISNDFVSQFRSLNEFKNILIHHQDRNVIDSYNENIFIDSLIELDELYNLMETLNDSL